MLAYLKPCHNSVRDQGVALEHIVVDGASRDGTPEWLSNQPEIISISEKDDGMYDAINKGIELSKGEIIAYLNCDEQYLPGTLKKVSEIFRKNSRIDILFGNTLIIRPNGELLACRKSFVPRWPYVWASHMYVHSSSMFVRKRVFDSGIMFDKSWKTVGDADFVVRVLRNGFYAQHVNDYFSAFMLTGSNLGGGENALTELKTFREKAPFWLRHSNSIAHALIRFEKFLNGAYSEKFPFSYSVYITSSLDVRADFVATSVSSFFPQEI